MPRPIPWHVQVGRDADDHVLRVRAEQFRGHTLLSDGYLDQPGCDTVSLRRNWNTLTGDPYVDRAATKGRKGDPVWARLPRLDPYLAVLRLCLQTELDEPFVTASAPGHAQKPDLVDVDTREVWEVKPDSDYGRATAGPQLERYIVLLDTAEREYLALSRKSSRYLSASRLAPVGKPRAWQRGANWHVPAMTTRVEGRPVRVQFTTPEPGVILWSRA